MNNKFYFEYSQKNEDEVFEFSKQEGNIVINKSPLEDQTELMKANYKLIDYITTYKTLCEDKKNNKKTINLIIDKIIYLIENTNLINYSSFCVYLQVVGYSYNKYFDEKNKMDENEKRELIKTLVDLYIQNRHNIYLYHGYSNQTLQVQSDAASSKRKGKTGIEKMEDILLPLGFKRTNNICDLEDNKFIYLLPDKGDLQLFNSFLKKNNIVFKFREIRENKNPDMLLAINNHYYIVEHKLTNGGGGSQNAEINEIIQFINYDEGKENWHYISCLQGDFFKKLNESNREPKAEKQFINIINNLENHPNNFFVNGEGFKKIFNDIVFNLKHNYMANNFLNKRKTMNPKIKEYAKIR